MTAAGPLGEPVAVAVDVVVFSIDPHGVLHAVLAPPRRRAPFRGDWALPGRRVRREEDLGTAARTVLEEFAGIRDPRHLEQVGTFGDPERDPRGRVVSVSYLALLPRPQALSAGACWFPLERVRDLAFDHATILDSALARLRAKLTYTTVAYGLLPDEFTLSDLQAVYESALGRPLDKRNFRRKLRSLGVVEEAAGQRRGAHRPARLYRFSRSGLVLLDDVIPA
jgi:8-oxo-dGTP diphosphatase